MIQKETFNFNKAEEKTLNYECTDGRQFRLASKPPYRQRDGQREIKNA